MTKIVLFLWTLSPTGQIDRVEIPGWFDMERCNAAGVSLIQESPHDGWQPAQVFRCLEVPK